MYDKFYEVFLPQKEVWLDVKGFEGCYKVSNYGRVKSLYREVEWFTSKGKRGVKIVRERFLKPKYDKDGYESYGLVSKDKKSYVRGHRLVAIHFIDATDHKNLVVDHKDTIVTNNFVWNLQWLTSTQNTIKHYGKDSNTKSLSSLSKYEWYLIGYLYKEGLSYEAIVANLGLEIKSSGSIQDVLSGRRLSSVTGFGKKSFEIRKHPTTKLDVEDVVTIIKKRLVDKKSLKVLAKEFNIAESMVSRFCTGKRQPEALKLYKERYE